MQIDQIETFLDLMETRSFNRTADRLGITQSTVSHRIRSMEQEFGKKLFSRSKAGTAPTSAGLRFFDHARALQRQWHEATRDVENAGAYEHSIRIGVQQDVAEQISGPWLSAIRKELPKTSLYMEVDYSTQMNRDLSSGELDLAIIYTPHFLPDLHYEKIGEIRYQMVSTLSPIAADIGLDHYISAHYSPAFERAHRIALPHLFGATISTGQNVAMTKLLKSIGGAAFVTDVTARELADIGFAHIVADIAPIPQAVYAATNVRTRHARQHRQLIQLAADLLAG